MSSTYSDLDKLVLERWEDIRNLTWAQRDIQERIKQVLETACERVGRWLREQGYESEYDLDVGEVYAWRPTWADRRKGPKVSLALGGFCPPGYRKSDADHPYLWVYTSDLENYKVKEPERAKFAADLRRTLGPEAKNWEAHDVDDTDAPLGQYLSEFGVRDQCRFVSNPDAPLQLAEEQYPKLFALTGAIETCLAKLQE